MKTTRTLITICLLFSLLASESDGHSVRSGAFLK